MLKVYDAIRKSCVEAYKEEAVSSSNCTMIAGNNLKDYYMVVVLTGWRKWLIDIMMAYSMDWGLGVPYARSV
jgi:hypothetical protein